MWSSVVDLSSGTANITTPKVAIDAAGDAVSIWSEFVSVGNNVVHESYIAAGSTTWSTPPLALSPLVGNNGASSVEMDAAGDIFALWTGPSGGFYPAFTTLGFAPIVPPSNGRGHRVKNRFALQSEYYNELEWSPSSSFISAYRVYRNGVLIAEIPASVLNPSNPVLVSEMLSRDLSYRDHYQRKGVMTTYTITAVGVLNFESAPLTIVIQ
jgi:hypothetical protein